jgi:hypothetical protein
MQILIRGNCGSSQGWTHNHQLSDADTQERLKLRIASLSHACEIFTKIETITP